MAQRDEHIVKIARSVVNRFPSLTTVGTDTHKLVRFVLAKRNVLERSRLQKIGDDVRDYMNFAYFLRRLSRKALSEISHLKRSEIKRRLITGVYPFSLLSQQDREALLYVPSNWVYGATKWRLNVIRHNKARNHSKKF